MSYGARIVPGVIGQLLIAILGVGELLELYSGGNTTLQQCAARSPKCIRCRACSKRRLTAPSVACILPPWLSCDPRCIVGSIPGVGTQRETVQNLYDASPPSRFPPTS